MIFYATKAGLNLQDFESMTVGMIEDVIVVYMNYMNDVNGAIEKGTSKKGKYKQSTGTIRDATQADFDAFSKRYGG